MPSSSSSAHHHHLLSDLAIHVNFQETFFLNEKIVCAYLGRLRKIIKQEKRRTQIKISGVEIDDFPGGPSGFELVARFCYHGGRVVGRLSISNVSLLHCSAVFLGMTEKVRSGNLLKQTEDFFQGMLDWPLPDIVSCLKTCDPFFPYADSLGLVQKLISGILVKIANRSRLLSDSADKYSSSASSTMSSPPMDHDLQTSKLRFSFSDSSSSNSKPAAGRRVECWWFDDLVSLSPLAIEKLVKTLGASGSENNSLTLTRFLLHYLNKQKITWTSLHRCRSKFHGPISRQQEVSIIAYSGLADTAIHGVILGGGMAFSYRGLLWVWRLLCGFGPKKACREELERMIGELLDQANLDDLLVCGNNNNEGGAGCVYDVDLVIRLVRMFIDQSRNQIQKMKRVARVIDKYLREISPDQNLKTSKFLEVAECLPNYARDSFDGVYRAIDIYLESHPTLSFKERSKLCRCLNFEKLSMEACKEIAKNPKIPPTIAVQALMSKTSILPPTQPIIALMPPSPRKGDQEVDQMGRKSVSLSKSPRTVVLKVKKKKKKKTTNNYNNNDGLLPDLHVQLLKYSCSPARGTDQPERHVTVPISEEISQDKMKMMNIVRMQKRVVELERACKEMKNQMSRMARHHNDNTPNDGNGDHGDGGSGLKLMAVPSSCGRSLGRICF